MILLLVDSKYLKFFFHYVQPTNKKIHEKVDMFMLRTIKNYPTWQNKHHVRTLRNFIQPEITISIAWHQTSYLNWRLQVLFCFAPEKKRIWKSWYWLKSCMSVSDFWYGLFFSMLTFYVYDRTNNAMRKREDNIIIVQLTLEFTLISL